MPENFTQKPSKYLSVIPHSSLDDVICLYPGKIQRKYKFLNIIFKYEFTNPKHS